MDFQQVNEFQEKTKMYQELKPNERLILLSLELNRKETGKEFYSLHEISTLTCIAKSKVFYYVKNLAQKDYLDMTDFGNMKQIVLKEASSK